MGPWLSWEVSAGGIWAGEKRGPPSFRGPLWLRKPILHLPKYCSKASSLPTPLREAVRSSVSFWKE